MKMFVFFLSVVILLPGCQQADQESLQEVVRPIKTLVVSTEQGLSERVFPGIAQASSAVTLAFEVSGKLNEIPVAVGDIVNKGDVLASLDVEDFKNALQQAEAELKRSRAQYERTERAAKANAVSKQELTNAQAAYESALAIVETRKKTLNDTKLRAPYHAIVTAKFIDNFGNVTAKSPAIRVIDPERIKMLVDIPEDIIIHAKVGMEVMVSYDSFPDLDITASISEIGSEASQSTRTYPVTLIMDQPKDKKILPGMSGRAWRKSNAVLEGAESLAGFDIPVSAIFADAQGDTFVWIFDKASSTVSRQAVQTGEITQHGVLVKGLNGGEIIATAGVNVLREGQHVRVTQ